MLNEMVIMGRLVRDPELRNTQSGTHVCTITVAVDRDYQPKEGEKETDFVDVVCWRNKADFVSKYFSKGKLIVVKGPMQSRKWKDKEGNNRVSWELQAAEVYFGGDKSAEGCNSEGGFKPAGAPVDVPFEESGAGFAEIEEDGELPF